MTTPIFVLGKQRSGTTWLSTQLSQHSQIAAVRSDRHNGIHESAYFSHVAGRYGDLSHKTNYIEFVEVMAISDTLRIIGIDKDFLYSLWPTTYEDVFRVVMERQAQKKQAAFWLDKTPEHTLMINKLAVLYPDAKFVAITRNAHDVMRSNMGRGNMGTRQRYVTLLRGALNVAYHNKEITHFAKRSDRIYVVRFEDMVQDSETVFRETSKFLNIEFEASLVEEAYKPVTTFRKGRERSKVFSKGEERLLAFIAFSSLHINVVVFRIIRRLTERRTKTLPRWFFSMYSWGFEKKPSKDTE